MKDYSVIKGKIRKINMQKRASEAIENIFFRIKKIDDLYYYAEEISTGSIFPIYNFIKNSDNKTILHTFSYIKSGEYFVFYPLIGTGSIFKYGLDKNDEDIDCISSPTSKEIEKYLKEKKDDEAWKNEMKKFEERNTYFCDINLIKEKLYLSDCNNYQKPILNLENLELEKYIPNNNIEEISEFGYDLSEKKNLCNLVGREEEIKKIIKEICIKKKSVLLKGNYGAGKTAIVEQLARDIKNKQNIYLEGKTIFYLNKGAINIGDDINKNIKKIVNYCKESEGNIILFIEDIRSFFNIHNLLLSYINPYIEDNSIIIIGTKSWLKYNWDDDYCYTEDELFKNIIIEDKSLELDVEILLSYINDLEKRYNIQLNMEKTELNEIIKTLIEASDKYSSNGNNKINIVKDILEDAFCEGIYEKKEFITLEDITIATIECDKLKSEFRLELANKTKGLLNNTANFNELNSETILNNTPQEEKKYIFRSKKRV